jgi:Transposase
MPRGARLQSHANGLTGHLLAPRVSLSMANSTPVRKNCSSCFCWSPKPERVRRLEVFTGAGRRRNRPAEQKARIVAESYESGEMVCAVARRHGFHHHATPCIAAYGFLVPERETIPPSETGSAKLFKEITIPETYRPRGSAIAA